MSASAIFFMGVVQFKVACESNEETVLCVQKEFQKIKGGRVGVFLFGRNPFNFEHLTLPL
jgi:hypothetical protein